jgi:hypothetical protein
LRKNCTEICVFNYTTMKTQILIFFLAMISYIANAQSVTIDPKAANPNLVEIKSTNNGFVIPKLNSAQRTSIISPQKGLLVFDTTTNSDWYFNGSAWIEIIRVRDKIGERSYQEAYLKAIPFTFFTSCPDFVTHSNHYIYKCHPMASQC